MPFEFATVNQIVFGRGCAGRIGAEVAQFGRKAFGFTGPALNNIWPRRWWPPRELREALRRSLGFPVAGFAAPRTGVGDVSDY